LHLCFGMLTTNPMISPTSVAPCPLLLGATACPSGSASPSSSAPPPPPSGLRTSGRRERSHAPSSCPASSRRGRIPYDATRGAQARVQSPSSPCWPNPSCGSDKGFLLPLSSAPMRARRGLSSALAPPRVAPPQRTMLARSGCRPSTALARSRCAAPPPRRHGPVHRSFSAP
jgi:hypothetical protein